MRQLSERDYLVIVHHINEIKAILDKCVIVTSEPSEFKPMAKIPVKYKKNPK